MSRTQAPDRDTAPGDVPARHVSGLSGAERARITRPRWTAVRAERRQARVLRVRRRTVTLALGGTALLVGAGVALAYWVSSGDGNGSTVLIAPHVTASVGTVTGQYPGAQPTTVPLVLHNDGQAPFVLTTVVPSDVPGDCPASAWRLDPPADLPTVPPSATVTVQVTVAMATDAPDSCQGATLAVPVTVSGTFQ
jgi:hypothetical protein